MGWCFDMLFVNVGMINDLNEMIGEVMIDEFVCVMIMNVLVLMCVIEML